MLVRLARDTYSSLDGPYISYEEKEVVNMTRGAVFTTLHFLSNLQMGPISLSVVLY